MPGLFGVVTIEPRWQLSRERLQLVVTRMATSLRHYDGYLSETFVDANAGLAVGRIGFPHLNSTVWKDQDHVKQQATYAFFAGNISSDGDAISHHHGEEWSQTWQRVTSARGSYSALIYSVKLNKTVILADRQASQPIYFTVIDGLLFFAPEVKALLACEQLDRTFDWAAMATFLASGYLLTEQTLFAGIRRLPGGSQINIAKGSVSLDQYWRFSPGEFPVDSPENELVTEVGQAIDAAVALDMKDANTTALLLSGGVDSRAILGAAYKAVDFRGADIHSVTWGCEPDRAGADIQIATQMAADLSLDHRTIVTNMATYKNYGEKFRRVNYLLDGMSMSAALHPDKFEIIENLYSAGYRTILRGEQTFGFAEREYSLQGAMAKLGLYRFKDIDLCGRIVDPDIYSTLVKASDQTIDNIIRQGQQIDPNDFTHRNYFRHRYQSMGGSAAYYKQVLMDHRTPLMDNVLLDMIQHLPKVWRDDKSILYHTVTRHYPLLAKYSYAHQTNLESWDSLISRHTPIRRFIEVELADRSSGIWNYLNRESLLELLQQVTISARPSTPNPHIRKYIRAPLKQLIYRTSPRLAARIRWERASRLGVAPYSIILRALILKNWHDTFVQG